MPRVLEFVLLVSKIFLRGTRSLWLVGMLDASLTIQEPTWASSRESGFTVERCFRNVEGLPLAKPFLHALKPVILFRGQKLTCQVWVCVRKEPRVPGAADGGGPLENISVCEASVQSFSWGTTLQLAGEGRNRELLGEGGRNRKRSARWGQLLKD